jgi:hypothetical protein
MAEPELPPARHEMSDVTFRLMATGLAGVLLTVLGCMVFVMWLYPDAVVDRRLGAPLPHYPAPNLQVDTHADLQKFEATELQQLDSAGWVDRAHNVVHIPIDDAMRLVAQRGIPDWPGRQEAQR